MNSLQIIIILLLIILLIFLLFKIFKRKFFEDKLEDYINNFNDFIDSYFEDKE